MKRAPSCERSGLRQPAALTVGVRAPAIHHPRCGDATSVRTTSGQLRKQRQSRDKPWQLARGRAAVTKLRERIVAPAVGLATGIDAAGMPATGSDADESLRPRDRGRRRLLYRRGGGAADLARRTPAERNAAGIERASMCKAGDNLGVGATTEYQRRQRAIGQRTVAHLAETVRAPAVAGAGRVER